MAFTVPDVVAVVVGIAIGLLVCLAVLLPKLRAAKSRVGELEGQLTTSREDTARLAGIELQFTTEKTRRESADNQNKVLNEQLGQVRSAASTAEQNFATASETVRTLREQLDASTARINTLENAAEAMRQARDAAVLATANAKKDLEAATALHEQTKAFLDNAGVQLKEQFQAVSAQVLDQRGKVLGEQHAERLGAVVLPLAQHLKTLEEKIESAEKSRAEDRGSMTTMIANVMAASTNLQTEASQLARSLRGNVKVRGTWGEHILESVLQASGLVEGVHYRKQVSSWDEDEEKDRRPDFVVFLPDERSVVIDSKVSLEAYHQCVNAEDDVVVAQELAKLIEAMRARIKELSDKNYAKVYGIGGLDFVFMFVPIEGALAMAVQQRPDLQTEALNKKIALVSPMTLLVALRSVEYVWRMDKLSRSMSKVIDKGRLVYDEAVRLGSALLKLDGALAGSRAAFDDLHARLLDPSRGIVRRAQELHKLGVTAKSKKHMPESLALAVDAGDELTQADTIVMDIEDAAPDGAGADAVAPPATDGA